MTMMLGAVLLVLAASCGGGGTSAGPTGPGNTGTGTGNTGGNSNSVSVGDDFFSPAATTVTAGTTVTWTWKGSISHNVTFDDGTASATQSSGTFSRVFNTAGTYPYHCTIHGTAMSGSVTVQ
jgi:plastocyanin